MKGNIDRVNVELVHLCERGSQYVGITIVIIGLAVLFGWVFHVEELGRLYPNLATMKFNTALLFLLSGLLLTNSKHIPYFRSILATLIVIVATLTLAQYVFNWNLHIDELFVLDNLTRLDSGDYPGRMSIMTAFNFLLVGGAFLLLRRAPLLTQWLAVIVGIIALLALVGYLYNVESLYRVLPFSTMALHTAAGFFALSIAILAKTTNHSFMKTSVSNTVGGVVIRWLLPIASILLLGLSWLRLQGQYLGLYNFEFGAALVTVTAIIVLSAVIIFTGNYLHHLDLQRIAAEQMLQQSHDELEERVHERTHQLQFANQELESFSYSISHDLRAPLRTISGFSQIVAEDYQDLLPEEGRNYLNRVNSETDRLQQMIDQLLAFSRLGKMALNKSSVDMNELVHEVLEAFSNEQEERNIDITIGNLPDCYADPDLLKPVLTNLLSNAFKYTRYRSKAIIEIGSYRENSECIYFVKDNGAGFDIRYAEKLFGVFQRMHSMNEFEGIGVGLSIVSRIVQRHGGRIWAEAEINKGATFYFTLESKDTLNKVQHVPEVSLAK